MWRSITRRLGKWTAIVVASVIAFTLGVIVGVIPSGTSTEADTTTVTATSTATATITTEAETVTINPTKEQRQKLAQRADQLDERAASVRQDERRISRMLGIVRRTSFGDGTFLVGREVRPGIYRAKNSGGGCYWA